ncbi:MAG: C39 family peptidase, partial [Ardenticatenaceae bacterium]
MSSSVRLVLPYVSQLGPSAGYGSGDSGVATVTSLVRAVAGTAHSVDDVARAAGLPPKFTSVSIHKLRQAAAAYGIKLSATRKVSRELVEKELLRDQPVILQVAYARLPQRYDPLYSGDHFVLVHGMDEDAFYYDDPYYPNATGADLGIAKEGLMQAVYALSNVGSGPAQALRCRSHTFDRYDPTARGLDALDESRTLALQGFTLSGTVT